ncbi:carboxylesterase family protein [Carboxylicivirga linearis]|uniref:Dienelactone hydrolase family protein n=1 Tax=Carboxylicivirga linearis TaxID=1628157 RepID=A0ABS5JRP6_9BACT|nr:dienelactone hydrolase family protein [Carboxylicivirga linearis]MBS2097559.1 dienelactone hydrolase family protein [Carboxylicivirga linearis]
MRILSLLILTFIAGTLWAQDYDAYQKKLFVKGSDTLQYRILYPENMKPGKKYPMVLFMHGAGERGSDNQKQLTHGGQLFLNQKNRKKYPAIVVFPQCPNGIMWTNRQKHKNKDGEWIFEFPVDDKAPWPALMVDQLVDEMIESGHVDESRLYIMGISMGGIGSLEFLYRFKNKYAAATIICGGHNAELASMYQNKPIWFFHGGKDDVVPMHYSREVYEKVKPFNKQTQYTIYPEANHNSWDPALAEPKLLKWLFSNRKK